MLWDRFTTYSSSADVTEDDVTFVGDAQTPAEILFAPMHRALNALSSRPSDPASNPIAAIERRRWPRRATFEGAAIVVGGRELSSCAVRDLSHAGARLQVGCSVGLPDQFDLVSTSSLTRRRCRIVWRSPRAMGVEFVR
jgi:hypothetical protein